MEAAVLRSPCKINLNLRVFERLANGYHRIETVMIKLALADEMTLDIGEGSEVAIRVPDYPALESESNLAVRAAEAYLRAADLEKSVRIALRKEIPIGGGLGGGSSNAGTVLREFNARMGRLTGGKLMEIAATLGADVPFFVSDAGLVLAEGVGEKLRMWPTPPARPVVLVNPGFPVSTAEAYKALNRPLTWKAPNGSSFAPRSAPEKWSDLNRLFEVGNDLQEVVEGLHPEIREIRVALRNAGAAFAQMSGSGSTVFGLFDDSTKAERAADKLSGRWRVFWTKTLKP